MTLVSYTNGNSPSTSFLTNRRRKLVGTAHSGPHWVNAVRVLRAATVNAYAQDAAWGRRSATADRVGTPDHRRNLAELDIQGPACPERGVRDFGSGRLTTQVAR